tara:strand:- start:384 stop:602 length:219 start_codon:yes stop_codon:yes gene_type:complete
MNPTHIKYEDWFECLMLVKPRLIIVEPPQEDDDTPLRIDVRVLFKQQKEYRNFKEFLKNMGREKIKERLKIN